LTLLLILLLSLGLRLYRINYPYLDHHSWRQTDTAMIAKNFYYRNFNILKPEVDWRGNEPSVGEYEFQVTTFLSAILYIFFGIKDWVGRIVPILFSLLSIVYIYRLVKFYFEEIPALFTAFVYAILPLNLFFTRTPMPDSGMLFFSIASVFHYSKYIKGENIKEFVLALVFTSLAFLSKFPGLCVLPPLVFIAFGKYKHGVASKGKVWLFFLIALSVAAVYYGYMHHAADIKMYTYKIGADKWGSMQVWQSSLFYKTLYSRLTTVIFTQLGAVLLVCGIFLAGKNFLFHVWLFSVILYFFAVGKGNQIHSYYQMPILPAGSLFIGLALYRIFQIRYVKYLSFGLCTVLLYLSVSNVLPLYRMYAYTSYEAAMKLKEIDSSQGVILSVLYRRDVMPELLYYADRKGWVISPEQLTLENVERYKNRGVEYIVVMQPSYINSAIKPYLDSKAIHKGERFIIVKP